MPITINVFFVLVIKDYYLHGCLDKLYLVEKNRQLIVSGFGDSKYVVKRLILLEPARFANRDVIFVLTFTLYNSSPSKSTL
jgi:hypothetical protein